MELKENVIEWITGEDRATVTLTQKKYINKVKNLARRFENEVDFIENADGSIIAHLPLKAVKLSIISSVNRDFSNAFGRSTEQKEINAE